MKYTDFKPDYHKIAQAAGLSNANNAWVDVRVCVPISPDYFLVKNASRKL
jgi:hypothetical protein